MTLPPFSYSLGCFHSQLIIHEFVGVKQYIDVTPGVPDISYGTDNDTMPLGACRTAVLLSATTVDKQQQCS